MPTPAIVLDGNQQQYGTPLITISGQTYKLNNISLSRAVTEASRASNDGRPSDQRYTAGVDSMTAELQLNSGVTYPKFGDTFTITLDTNYGSETWIVMPIDINMTNGAGDIRVAPLTARKAINPGAISTVN